MMPAAASAGRLPAPAAHRKGKILGIVRPFTLVVLVAAALIAALIVLTVVFTQTSRKDMLAAATHNLDDLSQLLVQQVERTMFGADLMVVSLQEEIEAEDMRSPDALYRHMASRKMHEHMLDMVLHTTDLDALGFADASGRLVSSRSWPPENVSVADREYFIALRDGRKQFISAPIQSKLTGQEILTLGRRVEAPDGAFLGIVFASLSAYRFGKVFDNLLHDHHDHALSYFLFRNDGRLLNAQADTDGIAAQGAQVWQQAEGPLRKKDAARLRLAGREIAAGFENAQLVVVRNGQVYPFTVAVARDEVNALKNWTELTHLAYAFAAGGIVLVLLVGWAFMRLAQARLQQGVLARRLSDSNAELTDINRRLEEAQHYANLGQWQIDWATQRNRWSKEMYRILEIPVGDAAASYAAVRAAVHPEDRHRIDALYDALCQPGSSAAAVHEASLRLLMSDGRVKHIVVRGWSEYADSGTAVSSTGSIQDVTALVAAEEEMRHARNAAQAASQAKSLFLANMSHEIRTPLNAVLGLAQAGVRQNLHPVATESFGHILAAGRHLLGVINDILDFSKIEAGKLTVERQPFRYASTVRECMALIAPDAQAKGLRIEFTVPPEPTLVSGDPLRLGQILTNLLTNAVKFTEHGSIRVTVIRAGELTHFTVADSGIGMTGEQLARLFAPFEQADGSTTRKYGGTGLGLAISRNLARLMGGDITVASRAHEGTAFTLTLPLPVAELAADVPALPQPVAAGPQLAGLRILAAEDVDLNRIVLEDMLTAEGAHVVFALNGRQAIELIEEHGASAFDVVLMDVQMPVMGGIEAAAHIHARAPELPVIGLTAHAMAEERERCLAAGMVAHVTKPIDLPVLIAAIRHHTVAVAATPVTSAGGTGLQEAPQAPADEAIDWAALSARYGNRPAFIDRLAAALLNGHGDAPAKLRAAVRQGDLQAMAFIAHSLKSAMGNIEALGVQALAQQAEELARNTTDPTAVARAVELADRLADATEDVLDLLRQRQRSD
jgi:signal transduction histidine kinase/DNA-binding response OmpR family regulator